MKNAMELRRWCLHRLSIIWASVQSRSSEFWLVSWTALLVFVTGANAWVLWLTDHTLRETLIVQRAAADRQVKMLSDTLMAQKTATELQLRAYLAVESGDIGVGVGSVAFFLNIKNSGQTPAFDVVVRYSSGLYHASQPYPRVPYSEEPPSRAHLGPGGVLTVSSAVEIQAGVKAEVEAGRLLPFSRGRVDYRDVFGNSRHLEFQHYGVYRVDGKWTLRHSPEGNTAN